jgi:hypothetical protein
MRDAVLTSLGRVPDFSTFFVLGSCCETDGGAVLSGKVGVRFILSALGAFLSAFLPTNSSREMIGSRAFLPLGSSSVSH